MHRGTTRCEHRSNHEMWWMPSRPSATSPPPPPSTRCPQNSTRAGAVPRAPGGAPTGVGNRAVTSQLCAGQSRSDTATQNAGATPADKEEGQRGRGGNQDSGNREPERRGWESVRMGGSNNTGDGLASQPHRYRVPGQPLLNPHQVGGVSRSPDGLFAQQEGEPTRGKPAVRWKGTTGSPQITPHTNTNNPPRGAQVPPIPPRPPPAQPSVSLHHHCAQQEHWPSRRPIDPTRGAGQEIGLPVGQQGP